MTGARAIDRRALLKLLGVVGSTAAATACLGESGPTLTVRHTKTLVDRSSVMEERTTELERSNVEPGPDDVVIDSHKSDQTFFGVGAALTDSAAYCLWTYLSGEQRRELLQDLFGPVGGCQWSVVRICLGDSDFRAQTELYTYNDVPLGETDPDLRGFSIARDERYIIPILHEILEINPDVRVIGAPWFHPRWMLRDAALVQSPSNQLGVSNIDIWARYLFRSVEEYERAGIPLYAVTPLNEPFSTAHMTINTHETTARRLRNMLDAAGKTTRIYLVDDNWSREPEVTAMFKDLSFSPLDIVAWHGYVGAASTQSDFRKQFPRVETWMTEFRSRLDESVAYTTARMASLLVSSLNGGTTVYTLWNLALDEGGNPTPYSPGRRGVVTVPSDGSGDIVRSPEYYVLAQLSTALQPGAVRVSSTSWGKPYVVERDMPPTAQLPGDVITTAFRNPDDTVVLYCYNDAAVSRSFRIVYSPYGAVLPVTMAPGELSTFSFSLTGS